MRILLKRLKNTWLFQLDSLHRISVPQISTRIPTSKDSLYPLLLHKHSPPSYLPLLSFCCVLNGSTSWTVRNIQSLHLYVFCTGCATNRVVFHPLLLFDSGPKIHGIFFLLLSLLLKQISKPVYCLGCSLIRFVARLRGEKYWPMTCEMLQIFEVCGSLNRLFFDMWKDRYLAENTNILTCFQWNNNMKLF